MFSRVVSFVAIYGCCCVLNVHGFSTAANSNQQQQQQQQYDASVYYDQSEARDSIDQACYTSTAFWNDVDKSMPIGWQTDSAYERFRGFCHNLKTEVPGREVFLENGQQLLAQYVYPGINHDDNVARSAYPVDSYKELQKLQQGLNDVVAPIARKELADLLEAKPLVSDDDNFAGIEENDGDTWQRAAWYGWQYLSLRGAKRWMPKTTDALKQVMGKLGPAHRFVGVSRQKEHCTGTEHSDGRNYMLSTLTPLKAPGGCGIVVDGQEAIIEEGGTPIVLDNTFPHYIFNNGNGDRHCLMSECWHPALTLKEREALATLFAVKDRFTVLELALAPWGYDDDSLEYALESGAVHDLDFWKDVGFDRQGSISTAATAAFEAASKKKKAGKKSARNTKSTAKGFGKA